MPRPSEGDPAARQGRPPLFGRVAEAPHLGIGALIVRFWPYARRYRWWFAASLAFVAIAPAIEAATIWLFKALVDDVLVPRDLTRLPAIAFAYLVLALVGGVVGFGETFLSSAVGERFVLDLRIRVFEHLQRLAPDVVERRATGDLLSRLSGDIAAIESLMLSGVTGLVAYVVQIALFAGALFLLDPGLAAASLVVAPLFWLASRRFSRALKRAAREQRRRSGGSGAVAEEALSNIALVQAYGREGRELLRYADEVGGMFEAALASARVRALFGPLVDLVELGGVLFVVWLGALAVSNGDITLGGLLVFVTYLDRLYRPVRGIARLANSVFSASASGERVAELLDEPIGVTDAPGATTLDRVRHGVRFDEVTFRYPGASRPALERVSFELRLGEVVALAGPNGSGKSTCAKLLVRFNDVTAGRITVDGIDVRTLRVAWLRSSVSLLLQELLVFDATIAENIAFGRIDARPAEVRDAAFRAGVDEFVRELPAGYETVIGPKGRRVSGGQRQRIALARALLRDAPIVVLDEPTTALDVDTTMALVQTIRSLARDGRAVLLLTHSDELLRLADRVVRLEHGHVVERARAALAS